MENVEGPAQPLGNRQDDLPMRHLLHDLMPDELAELLDLFLVATRAEIALLATEGDQVIVPAVVAMQSGEATAQVTAGFEGIEGSGDLRAEPAVLCFESTPVLVEEVLPVLGEAVPERRSPWTSRVVEGNGHEKRVNMLSSIDNEESATIGSFRRRRG